MDYPWRQMGDDDGPGVWAAPVLRVTNVSDRDLILHDDAKLGIWLTKDRVPRAKGFV